MASDPKGQHVTGRRRLLTIHDGARLTPSLARLLEVLADEAAAEIDETDHPTNWDRERAAPVLVARSDGLAVYVHSRRIG